MSFVRRVALAAAILAAASFAQAKDEKWVEARSPNFIVVTNAGSSQAKNTAIQFEQIRALFRQSFDFAKDQPTPVITVLAAKDENTLKALLPEYWATKGHTHPAGIFLDSTYQLQVAVQLSGEGDNPLQPIYHEYYHSLTIPYFSGLPVWISEGLADFYGNSKVVDKTASLGMPDAGLIEVLREQPMIPLQTLFRVDQASSYYNENTKATIFYAESWALIHFLMMGDHDTHRPQLVAYLDALSHGASQDEAAAKAFGDLGKLQKALQAYVSNFTFYEMRTAAPAKIADSDLKLRALTEAEADAYRGGFLALHQQFNDAEALLQEAARSDAKLALAQQNLGVLYYEQHKIEDARNALDAAIEIDPRNALTRFLRADLAARSGGSGMSDSQIDGDLRAAIAADPNFAPPYGLLASRLAGNGQSLPEAFELAKKSVQLEPGVSSYQFVLAQVLARAHKYDQAQVVANRLAANALDPRAKENAAQLLDYVQKLKDAEAMYGGRRQSFAPSTNAQADTTVQASTGSAGSSDSADSDDDDTEEPEKPANDGKSRIDGTVTEVQCKAQDMVITLATPNGTVKLHAPDNTRVDYISDVQLKSETFWPCTSLNGHTVKAKFLPAKPSPKQPYQGELTNVEIRK